MTLPEQLSRIVMAVTIAVYCIEFLQLHKRFKILYRKPFNCEICLPVWVYVAALPIPAFLTFIISGALLSGIITSELIQWLRKN